MLALDGRFLSSRLARRLFLVFVLSALLPVGVFGLLSLDRVERELAQSAARELRRESKGIGMEILARLVALEDGIRVMRRASAFADSGAMSASHADRGGYWRRVTVRLPGDRARLVLGDSPLDSPELSPQEVEHLGADGVLLRLLAGPEGDLAPTLIAAVTPGRVDDGLVLAQIEPDFLWNVAVAEEAHLCILEGASVLWCNDSPGADVLGEVGSALGERDSGGFEWGRGEHRHSLRFWTIFLDARFAAEGWTVVLTAPLSSLQASVQEFQRLFWLSVVLALLVVVLASVVQIRRYLVPLDRLREATVRIAQKRFSEPVVIESGDELEELGASFNAMTGQLDRQFKLLETLGEIDRVLLSSHDPEYIIETLLRRVSELTPSSVTGLIRLGEGEAGGGEVFLADETAAGQRPRLQLSSDDAVELGAFAGPFAIDAPFPRYLGAAAGSEVRRFLVWPIHTKERLAALLFLGFAERGPDPLGENASLVTELANRAAVAMTNADWEAQLYRQAHYDHLTALPNRLLFRDRFEQAMARSARTGTSVALLFVDLDRFKSINDSLGHAVGDELLVEATRRFLALGFDSAARFGGDEFMVMVPDLLDDGALSPRIAHLAESLCREASEPFEIGGRRLTISASIGISLYPRDAQEFDSLLRHADAAMYHAKALGKAGYQFYAPELNAAAVDKLELEAQLRRALEQRQFELHYQPKVGVSGGRVEGVEALVRWRHPERGMVSPGKFIPLAEETGLIVELGAWVLESACRQGAAWRREGLPGVRISVNLSANQFRDAKLIGTVREALERTGLPAEDLELEVTEGTVMSDVGTTSTILQRIKEMGVKVSLDDFGTGYSSLAYLTQFPLDVLKVDQSFVRRLPTDRAVGSIVAAIVSLAHSLEMSVVAEGVETEEQIRRLTELGCDELQGYFFSRPVPAPEFAALLRDWSPWAPSDAAGWASPNRASG